MRRLFIVTVLGGLCGAALAYLIPAQAPVPARVVVAIDTPKRVEYPPTPTPISTPLESDPEAVAPGVREARAKVLSKLGKQTIAPADLDDRYREPAVRLAMEAFYTSHGAQAPDLDCDYYPCIAVGLMAEFDLGELPDGYPNARIWMSSDSTTAGMVRVTAILSESPFEGSAVDNLELRRVSHRSIQLTLNLATRMEE